MGTGLWLLASRNKTARNGLHPAHSMLHGWPAKCSILVGVMPEQQQAVGLGQSAGGQKWIFPAGHPEVTEQLAAWLTLGSIANPQI